MEPVSGQLLLNFDQTELRRLLSFPGRNESDERARRQQADSWFQKGLELERAGGPVEEAISAYETAATLDPTSAGALVNLGTIYFNARTWSKSEHYYRTAIEVDPNYALAHFNLANLYDERGDYAQAMVHYETAVKLNPRYSDAHYNLALLYQGNGQVMEAVRHWKSYLKLDPGSAWSAIARRELDKLRKTTVLQGKLVR
jgi:tetratricopeptide (TPR) repeat protein